MKTSIFLIASLLCFALISSFARANVIDVSDISPKTLVPGEESDLSFKIENVGDEDLEKLVFSWEEKSGSILPIGSSNTKIIEELEEDDEETLDFQVFTSASAEPNLYEIVITIKFGTGNQTVTETSKAGIIVGGGTDFDVSVSDYSSGDLTLSVANIGQNPADAVTLTIPEQTGFRTTGASSSIIGNLEKGDYSAASFQVSQMSGGGMLGVDVYYTDTTGARQKITKTVELSSSSPRYSSTTTGSVTSSSSSSQSSETSSSTFVLVILGLVTLVAVIVLFVVLGKNKKKNEEN